MSGIGEHIDKWENDKAESFNKCCDCFANYILFLPRLLLKWM